MASRDRVEGEEGSDTEGGDTEGGEDPKVGAGSSLAKALDAQSRVQIGGGGIKPVEEGAEAEVVKGFHFLGRMRERERCEGGENTNGNPRIRAGDG